ncbi:MULTISPECIES: SDR family NAD(P)-dependent oxidoreductase [unclassified Pseudoclavibacter]|jgi:NAD(P)-dependent dehydrogenase (short-subunit alcohol dehydrogenase family)|uniref:SDR family NAD(P)-dependent oxidoreductase n=1 Tax=unclassified Pseudoclavibacter TaxID=2615177 RepID=UPI000CE7ED31|nr:MULTISPECIES: glucose 1-dehydrogenase [unclassified Pseudoclavibacter]MBS3179307.1 glucose 1-dehydrogenase [Pseudoclavibacter sp. Marseille-Q4354]PPG27075.1 oxidoreductase [Pseudoclavibacter sp. RFBB5]
MTDFSGRSVLITGGAGGIGAATAEEFLKLGARVALVDLFAEPLEATRERLAAHGDVITITADVTNEADVERYVAETVEAFGTIDVFFNNAGIEGAVGPLTEASVDNYEKVFAVNVRGVFLGMKHVLKVMTERGSGSIINTSSEAGLDGSPGVSAYVASKHAVVGFTKSAALEVAATGVRVNSIHPSGVNTQMVRRLEEGFGGGDTEAAKAGFQAAIPMGRYAEPLDIARVVVFLGSDEASFVTGAQWRVDGGNGAR